MTVQPRLDRTLDDMIAEAHTIIDECVDRWQPEAIYAAFSGGNDSTVMLDVVRDRIDGVLHVDTTIGIARTRQFVEQTCHDMGLPLTVTSPPHDYEHFVRSLGFPGPSAHRWAYIHLKERAVNRWKRTILEPRKSTNVMLLTGVRVAESSRRMLHGSQNSLRDRIAWVSPLRHWTSDDMAEYRQRRPVLPRNPVSEILGMSGECMCGAYGHPVELEITRTLDPTLVARVERLQDELAAGGRRHCRWGPGGAASGAYAGPLCTGCDQAALFDTTENEDR